VIHQSNSPKRKRKPTSHDSEKWFEFQHNLAEAVESIVGIDNGSSCTSPLKDGDYVESQMSPHEPNFLAATSRTPSKTSLLSSEAEPPSVLTSRRSDMSLLPSLQELPDEQGESNQDDVTVFRLVIFFAYFLMCEVAGVW
jgi:hypothetical protein